VSLRTVIAVQCSACMTAWVKINVTIILAYVSLRTVIAVLHAWLHELKLMLL
jgi:hypothetical protein